MTISQGDGTFQQRLNAGQCPKCHTESLEKIPDGVRCTSCNLSVTDNSKFDDEDATRLAGSLS